MSWSFFAYNCSFFAYSGKVPVKSTSTDCKQRSSIVSKKLQLQVEKLPPFTTGEVCSSGISHTPVHDYQDDGKGGLGLRGVAFMTVLAVFDGFGGSGKHLVLLLLVLQIQYQETTVTVLTVLAVSAVVAVSVVTATPLKLNPLFSSS